MGASLRTRRLATVLFLDVVGSTSIAADLGDRRWRALQTLFRRAVRAELKRHGGHEEDTAGDGFFATFREPAQAARAAVAVATRVQAYGVEVRCGLHTGECEVIDGKLGGIAAHIGARIMSLAGPAEVLVSSTVCDLVVGSGIAFEDFSLHELKGVPGTWQIFAVTAVDGKPVPAPLEAAAAAQRLASVQPPATVRRRRGLLAGAALVTVVVVGAVFALSTGGSQARPHAPAPAAPVTISLLSIDPENNSVHVAAKDQLFAHHRNGVLWVVNGALWQATDDGIVRRDTASGAVKQTIPLPDWKVAAFGFGSLWVGNTDTSTLLRFDPVSGQLEHTERLVAGGRPDVITAGKDAMWMVDDRGLVYRIDPVTGRTTRTVRSGATSPGAVVPLPGGVFVCDCINANVIEISPNGRHVVRHLALPQHGYLINVASPADGNRAYLVDIGAATLTPFDAKTGVGGRPIGVGGDMSDVQIGFGAIWVASVDAVYRVDLVTQVRTRIPMPKGISAASIATDPVSGRVWVGSCGCPRP
jgi:class 3 adenylate cyclase/streptogramin lyase